MWLAFLTLAESIKELVVQGFVVYCYLEVLLHLLGSILLLQSLFS